MLSFPERPENWKSQAPYWNAKNMRKRELLLRLHKATATITLIAWQYTETINITANEFFKNIVNLYMNQQLLLCASKKLRGRTGSKCNISITSRNFKTVAIHVLGPPYIS